MHVTDTLDAGGAERMAVNLVNLLPRDRYLPHLCTTRREGPLASLVTADVGRLRLGRRRRFDAQAFRLLNAYLVERQINVIHAHGTSLFLAVMASMFPPYPVVVWHDHYGKFEDRPEWLYRLASHRLSGVVAVNRSLAEWARQCLRLPAERVDYVPNFVLPAQPCGVVPFLPGAPGGRIVCVANFRSEKDHLTLVRAMVHVVRKCPAAHLLLAGAENEAGYLARVRAEVSRSGLEGSITFLGPRPDVVDVLVECDIGVLSSSTEGLPLALLEYGAAGLPAVATRVGHCAEVLDGGRAGLLVRPAAPEQLAASLLELLESPERRMTLACKFRRRVQEVYNPEVALQRICRMYDEITRSHAADGKDLSLNAAKKGV
jgi:glycosyltransferase involved in cell wall biosynthesis